MGEVVDWGPADGKKRTVHIFGDKPAPTVVVLHELEGATDRFLQFATWLAGNGYRVLAPELFGRGIALNLARICLSREFAVFASGRTSPVADWVRALCSSPLAGSDRVAVVGMCATGGLVLSTLVDQSVRAGVIAQPSLPFRWRSTTLSMCEFGASAEDAQVVAGGGKPVLTMRFEDDWICPKARLDRLDQLFADKGSPSSLTRVEFPGDSHSTLVADAAVAVVDGVTSRDLVLEFLAGVEWNPAPGAQGPESGTD